MKTMIISASLSPNAERDDVREAARVLFQPWKWLGGAAIGEAEAWFDEHFPNTKAVSFNSGRAALLAILNAFQIGRGDEVLLQAFTCVAVPNSVLWAGAAPVYVDIDASLNLDVRDAENKLTKKTRAIIVQHTLGNPAKMEVITRFAAKHNLILIEDCAHSLGATYRNKDIGSFGDAAFFSFGRDKVLSSVFGGMAVIPDKHAGAQDKIRAFHGALRYPSVVWIFQQIFHPIAFSRILPVYTSGLGKAMLVILQKLHLLSFPVYREEKAGRKPRMFPTRYPNALARLLLRQLPKLRRYNETRRSIAAMYQSGIRKIAHTQSPDFRDDAIFLRYPVVVENPAEVLARAKKNGILLGNWYHCVIDPDGVDFEKIGYTKGSCPKAEKAALKIINLPTLITKNEAERVMGVFS